jgi:hypothetical protein
MKEKDSSNTSNLISMSETQGLLESQRDTKNSIRTTFRIPPETIERFKELATGYKLIDAFELMASMVRNENTKYILSLETVLSEIRDVEITGERKSYLINTISSRVLSKFSRDNKIQRDQLVVFLFGKINDRNIEKNLRRRELYKSIKDKLDTAIKYIEEAEELASTLPRNDDPLREYTGDFFQEIGLTSHSIAKFLESGEWEEPYGTF